MPSGVAICRTGEVRSRSEAVRSTGHTPTSPVSRTATARTRMSCSRHCHIGEEYAIFEPIWFGDERPKALPRAMSYLAIPTAENVAAELDSPSGLQDGGSI